MDFFESVLPAILAGMASGLITWGAIRTELKWLRRDTDLAHERIDDLEGQFHGAGTKERRTTRVRSRTRQR